jgi:predicted DNA-binding protein (MmcQ/YjbR family)
MAKAQRTISDVVREIMAALPEVEEFVSHGSPTFRVRGRKVFATYMINHHGDGRVALWLMAPPGAQAAFVEMSRVQNRESRAGKTKTKKRDAWPYFVPPYVGPSGWLGIELDKGLGWTTVCEHVREAYALVAPAELVRSMKKDFRVRSPTRKFRPEEIEPFEGKPARAVLKKLDTILSRLPDTERGTRFGSPTWLAGTKVFATAHYYTGRLKLSFWVGAARQKALVKNKRSDKRFEISPYTGHSGWIDLDVGEEQDWDEIGALAVESYRHFALKRMLKMLDELPSLGAPR